MRLIPRLLVAVLGVGAVVMPAPASAAGTTCAAGEICFGQHSEGGPFWTTTSYEDSTHYDNYFYGTGTRGRDQVSSLWNRKQNGIIVIDWRDGADVIKYIGGYTGGWIYANEVNDKNNAHNYG